VNQNTNRRSQRGPPKASSTPSFTELECLLDVLGQTKELEKFNVHASSRFSGNTESLRMYVSQLEAVRLGEETDFIGGGPENSHPTLLGPLALFEFPRNYTLETLLTKQQQQQQTDVVDVVCAACDSDIGGNSTLFTCACNAWFRICQVRVLLFLGRHFLVLLLYSSFFLLFLLYSLLLLARLFLVEWV
jgi:hypothetical protein